MIVELNMTCETEDLACFESYYLPEKKGHSSELLENDWRARKLFKLITRINDFLVAAVVAIFRL